jgi:hypothetical protein
MREEAEDSQAVVDGHQHHAFPGERFAVGAGCRARATGVAAGMEPHHHGTLVIGGSSGRPDVEVETIFAHRLSAAPCGSGTLAATFRRAAPAALHAHWSELIGHAGSFPFSGRLRSAKTQIANGWCRKRDAFIDPHAGTVAGHAGDHSGIQTDGIVNGREYGGRGDNCVEHEQASSRHRISHGQ